MFSHSTDSNSLSASLLNNGEGFSLKEFTSSIGLIFGINGMFNKDHHYESKEPRIPLRRSSSFLDGYSSTLNRSVDFGIRRPSVSEIYQNTHERAFSLPSHSLTPISKQMSKAIEVFDRKERVNEQTHEHAQMLLVSLIANFCVLFERNPKRNKRLFLTLCGKLYQMGIISSRDMFDKVKILPESYKNLFQKLVYELVGFDEFGEPLNNQKNEKKLIEEISDFDSAKEGKHDDSEEDTADFLGLSPKSHPSTGSSNSVSFFDDSSVLDNSEDFAMSSSSPITSRLDNEFCELEPIGRGGFSTVYKAMNKLDGHYYAFKKIHFKSIFSEDFHRISREIKTLAHLEHRHIIRYNGAWIEEVDNHKGGPGTKLKNSFLNSINSNSSNSSTPQADTMGIKIPIDSQSISFEREEGEFLSHGGFNMIIQMELCQFTLADWIEQRNFSYFFPNQTFIPRSPNKIVIPRNLLALDEIGAEVKGGKATLDKNKIFKIFKGIVQALEYVHSENVIHRDLKPGNIFFKSMKGDRLDPKLGDFGLASMDDCKVSSPLTPFSPIVEFRKPDTLSFTPTRHQSLHHYRELTCGLGTLTYCAPEQIEKADYNEKTDIFSLGFVLFEMLCPIKTFTERSIILGDLREGQFPALFLKELPNETAFIWSCLAQDPNIRPSAQQILSSQIIEPEPNPRSLHKLTTDNQNLKRLLEEERAKTLKLQESLSKFTLSENSESLSDKSEADGLFPTDISLLCSD